MLHLWYPERSLIQKHGDTDMFDVIVQDAASNETVLESAVDLESATRTFEINQDLFESLIIMSLSTNKVVRYN